VVETGARGLFLDVNGVRRAVSAEPQMTRADNRVSCTIFERRVAQGHMNGAPGICGSIRAIAAHAAPSSGRNCLWVNVAASTILAGASARGE
jgi:hypothetical protein